jgi:hypothetical protein
LFVRVCVFVGKETRSRISLGLKRLPPGRRNVESAGGAKLIDRN